MPGEARTTARIGRIVAVAAIGALLAGCASPVPEQQPDAPTEVVVGAVGELTSFNPYSAHGATEGNRAAAVYLHESFASLDDRLQVEANGGFGEVERISADPLQVRYRLFDDRRWSDGAPVTVDDLLLGWAVHSGWFDDAVYDAEGDIVTGTRYFDVAAPTDGVRETRRPQISRIENTITLTYEEPFADWNREWLLDRPVHLVAEKAGISVADLREVLLTAPRGDPLAPAEPNPLLLAAADAWNTGFDLDPAAPDLSAAVSDGPYVAQEWHDGRLDLVRNASYRGDRQPAFERLVLRYFADENSLRDAVADGAVDVANLGEATPAELTRLERAGVAVYPGPRPHVLALVFSAEGTTDAATRAALVSSLDRERLVDETVRAVDPSAAPADSFLVSPASGEPYREVVSANGAPGPGPDLARAEELLDGKAPVVRVRYDPTDILSADLFAHIAGMAQDAGISVRPWAEGEPADADLVSLEVGGTLYSAARERVVHSAGGLAARRALERMRERSDPEEVAALAAEIDRALYADGYGIPLVARVGVVAAAPDISGVQPTAFATGAPRSFWMWSPGEPSR